MDVQKQQENTERNWNKEKMELLERFDNERKEWECQWKVMQKKIEELYQEVKLRRESNMNVCDNKTIHSKLMQRFEHPPASEQSNTAGLNYQYNIANNRMEEEILLNKGEKECKEATNKKKNKFFSRDQLAFENGEKSEDGLKTPKKDTKDYTGDLNVALKELAKVSEELCSYQEEIRKKSNHRRMKSLPFLGESEQTEHTVITPEMACLCSSDPQTSSITFETEEQKNRKNFMGTNRGLKDMSSCALVGDGRIDLMPWQKKEAPPVPPRSTSRHLTSSLSAVVQIAEVTYKDAGSRSNCKAQECRNGRKCINPFLAKQSGTPVVCAKEGKSVKGAIMTTVVPTAKKNGASECSMSAGFCHNTWSCDAGKFGNFIKNGSPPLSSQKSCSDGNMVSAEKLDQKPHPKSQRGLPYSSDLNASVTIYNDSLGDSGYSLENTQRNEKLAAKIDEFNRTVFLTNKSSSSSQENQMLPMPSEDYKTSGQLHDSMVNGMQTENVSCVSNHRLTERKEQMPCHPSKNVRTTGQPKQINGLLSTSGYQHMLHEHDWRPSNLSGRPRSADSRSNYGVVEKLLKNYEKSTVTSLCKSKCCKDKWTQSESEFRDGSCETLSQYLQMLQREQGKHELQRNSTRHAGQQAKQGKERQKLPEISLPTKSSTEKGFSRPARPANRRLPSRWASRSPSAPPAVRRMAHNYSLALRSETSVV